MKKNENGVRKPKYLAAASLALIVLAASVSFSSEKKKNTHNAYASEPPASKAVPMSWSNPGGKKYQNGDIVLSGGTLYICIKSNGSCTAPNDTSADWISITDSVYWMGGAWAAGFVYVPGAVVQHEGSSYLCLQKHAASASNAPPDATRWTVMGGLRNQTCSSGEYVSGFSENSAVCAAADFVTSEALENRLTALDGKLSGSIAAVDDKAIAAQAAAGKAQGDATQALTNAANADGKAVSAQADATKAVADAAAAQGTANQAKDDAAAAQGDATQALTNAAAADTKAANAQTAADEAKGNSIVFKF